jgi:enterochelin esterase family protein
MLSTIVPLIDSTYRTKATAAGRAISGLSMGGMQALQIGINHPDMFAYVGGMSAYVPEPEKLLGKSLENKDINNQLKLLWMSIGKDDVLLKDTVKFHELLIKHGLRVEWTLGNGFHDWTYWRQALRDFAPLLFQSGK